MKIENIPAGIKSKSLKEARDEINQILTKLENEDFDLNKTEEMYKRLINLNKHVESLFKIKSKKINALCVLDNGRAVNISQLSALIKSSSFVIANDTGPAHMAAHLEAKGLTLFGSHTSAFLQSIETENFKAIQVTDLSKLSPEKVFEYFLKSVN